ncbi:MAG TPA: OB-fold nucleic acid binding domain-containing protein [Methanocorpusculum sp.]|nr:OB-fold nucleic acid binding domain-containing protein [Methanocorpusculum sp.]HJJ50785.1 OB-fold nucleic acid binding domain-containing protein [Methanocorpusculum sp.]
MTDIVYRLGPGCEVDDIVEGNMYIGKVQGFATFGTFVQLNDTTKGLLHKSNVLTDKKERDSIIVLANQVRPNGNIDLREVILPEGSYETQLIAKKISLTHLSELATRIGRNVTIEADVVQIKQTSGPTIFTICDDSGVEDAAAFTEAGVRSYPEVNLGDVVRVFGEATRRNNQMQIEVSGMQVLKGEEADNVRNRINRALEARAEPPEVTPLIKSDVIDALWPEMRKLAKIVRRAVLTQQPIIIRHHADADGICSAVSIETAVTQLIRDNGGDPDQDNFLLRRSPSKAPFYEIEDVTRDLDMMLKDNVRFGQKLPLILLTDNGSTEEDMPSYKMTEVYNLDVVVADHHHPDDTINKYLLAHVNPYHVGGDFGVTAGMLGTEIARLINPAVESRILHFPAIAGVADRSDAPELDSYLALIAGKYTREECKDMAVALDYEQYWLRFNDGREIVRDILNINNAPERHVKLVNLLVSESNLAIQDQMNTMMPHVKAQKLTSGANLFLADVEMFAHRFTFPPPGKSSGEVHDILCKKHVNEPVITLGLGPDFAVIRSRGVKMNIPQMVRSMRDEMPGAGISGGGHLVVGSIKFVEGMRSQVIEKMIEKISEFTVS